jgi:hypothetical protein
MKTGMRFKSAVCPAEGVVVRAAQEAGDLTCGGVPVAATGEQAAAAAPLPEAREGAALLGKRYVDEASGLEVLCTKNGFGELAFAGRLLTLKQAKSLPASD